MRARETALTAAREVRCAFRARWFFALAGGLFVLALALSLVGLAGSGREGLAGFDRTSASLLNLALLFVPLATLTLGALGLSGELEDGSLGLLLSQPVTRAEVFFGKYLGTLAAVGAAVLAGCGAASLVVAWGGGSGRPAVFATVVAVIGLLAAATLAIGVLLSVVLPSRARATGAAFLTWLLLVYVSDLGTMGLAVARGLDAGQVFALALLNPLQQARLLGTLAVSSRLEVLGPAGIFGLDHFGAVGLAVALVAALAATAAAAVAAGYAVFRKVVVA
jgi:Cu-processing system permease protein